MHGGRYIFGSLIVVFVALVNGIPDVPCLGLQRLQLFQVRKAWFWKDGKASFFIYAARKCIAVSQKRLLVFENFPGTSFHRYNLDSRYI